MATKEPWATPEVQARFDETVEALVKGCEESGLLSFAAGRMASYAQLLGLITFGEGVQGCDGRAARGRLADLAEPPPAPSSSAPVM